jgi:hypothetical protein
MLIRNMLSAVCLRMQGNRLDDDMSWTHQRLNKKELRSFMTSGEKIT